MRSGLNIPSFLQLVAFSALILFAWRGLEFVSDGGLQNPVWRGASAQETPEAEPDASEEQASTEAASEEAEEPDPNKRLTAKEVMELRATDVSESFGSNDELLESERNVLIRLSERREQIEKLEEELVIRERLIEVAEKRIDSRIAELKSIEKRLQQQVEVEDEDVEDGLTNLVVMYEAMKPKDAARIFNTLDLQVLVSVVEQMNPRTMSAVLAAMDPKSAQRLTLTLASRGAESESTTANELGSIANDG